eukprot:gene5457-5496_t
MIPPRTYANMTCATATCGIGDGAAGYVVVDSNTDSSEHAATTCFHAEWCTLFPPTEPPAGPPDAKRGSIQGGD